MNSAYSLFKRPAIISGRPFRKSDKSMTGVYVAQKHYSANIPQEINLAAFPRQLIADKGSFDGGQGSVKQAHGDFPYLYRMSPLPAFRAALPERRINVDRVSINCGEVARFVAGANRPANFPFTKLYGCEACSSRNPTCSHAERGTATTFNADSYSRYCLCVLTSQLGKYRTTSSPQVEHRGRELEQWDKPLCASVPALHGSIGSDKRDELSFNGRGLALPGYWI